MLSRVILIALGVFWLGMNVLLWRAEFGGHNSRGSAIPPSVVWQKILTAPDSSSLTVLHHGKKVGFCHWVTSVGEELARMNDVEVPPRTATKRVMAYRLHLEGNLAFEEEGTRIRFDSNLKLRTNQTWQEFNARLNFRPTIVDIKALAQEKAVHIETTEGKEKSERVIKFSELQNPARLIGEFGGPVAAELFSNFEWPGGGTPATRLTQEIPWEARNDSIKIGHSQVRAYRLQATVLDRFRAVIFVSRVGEILRVELPDEILLVNDQLGNF